MDTITLGPTNGTLQLRTDIAGAAARMGHRLLIDVPRWQATVQVDAETPRSIELTAELSSLVVISGEGGVKPITNGDRLTIADNAKKSLDVARNPLATFTCSDLAPAGADWRLSGTLEVNGQRRPVTATVSVTDAGAHWQVASTVPVDQRDYGVKPYSAMLGKLRVGDVVRVEFSAAVAK